MNNVGKEYEKLKLVIEKKVVILMTWSNYKPKSRIIE